MQVERKVRYGWKRLEFNHSNPGVQSRDASDYFLLSPSPLVLQYVDIHLHVLFRQRVSFDRTEHCNRDEQRRGTEQEKYLFGFQCPGVNPSL